MRMDDWKLSQRLKIERTLNFSTIPQEEDEFSYSRRKIARDPMSHRIIEKRRRDRMNNCLADLSRLIPHQYMKKGRGRIEKTEIIEMAIKHLKHLQAHSCKDPANCEVAKATEQESQHQYRLGFQECMSEAVRFLVEAEGMFPAEGTCFRLLAHLQDHYNKLARGCYSNGRVESPMTLENSSSAQMDVDAATIQNGGTIDGYSVTSLKHSASPLFEHSLAPISPPQQQHLQMSDNQADDRCQVLPSQLREMLQNPNVPTERMRSNSTSSTASSYSSRPSATVLESFGNPKGPSCEEVYKFKTNIKERFNADLHLNHDGPSVKFSVINLLPNVNESGHFPPNSVLSKCRSPGLTVSQAAILDSPNKNNELLCAQVTDIESGSLNIQTDPQNDSSNGSSSPASNGQSSSSGYSTSGELPAKVKLQESRAQSPEPDLFPRVDSFSVSDRPTSSFTKPAVVPIFALHPKGNFYIPMSLEAGLVDRYLSSLEGAVPILHPVSISVNFCRPTGLPAAEQTSWHSQTHIQQEQDDPNNRFNRYRDRPF